MNIRNSLLIVAATSLIAACGGAPVTPSINSITLSAAQVALRENTSSLLTASLGGTGAFDPAITWKLEAGAVGTLSGTTGNTVSYTAPNSSFGRVVRITASSVQDSSIKKTIFISVNPVKDSIAGGDFHSLALKFDGTMLSWGFDGNGELGDDATIADKPTPVAVSGATGIVAIAVGFAHSLALKSDGTMLSWGYGIFG